MKSRVLVAMSGGVDSAVAAARLFDQGYEVIGCTLHLWDYPDDPNAKGGHNRCCAPEDQYDARRTADFLGFRHFTFDRRELFEQKVVNPFVDAYADGLTPSPCTICNRTVKLRELLQIADRLGAEKIATGHYARIGRDDAGAPHILAGKDTEKDQSYFLYATPRELLERLVFPLGESTKPEVRHEAVTRGLPGSTKGESQELCFVGQGARAYSAFVESRSNRIRPGPILGPEGQVLGTHGGVHNFTIGQRKGLGVATGEPVFVTEIDSATNSVHLGNSSGLDASSASLADLFLAPGVTLPIDMTQVKVRYRHAGAAATVRMDNDNVQVLFRAPVRALTRGQVAVFYDNDRVLGGGTIREVNRAKAECAAGASL